MPYPGPDHPDSVTQDKLITLGKFAEEDPRFQEALTALRNNRYLHSCPLNQPFDFLQEMEWTEACAFVRGLTWAEIHRIASYGGSVSIVKDAYRALEMRDRVAALEVAAWIVDHSNNDYIPFPMRKVRHAFEGIKRTAVSWDECREALDRWNSGEFSRQRRVADEISRQQPEAERRRKIKAEAAIRLHGERSQVQQARASAREKLLAQLQALPVLERLEHLAWDEAHALSYYPSALADCDAEVLGQLDPITKARLIEKLRGRRTGPWQKIARRLGLQ